MKGVVIAVDNACSETLWYQPKVSIIIPAYNASNYLAAAIESALNQTYPNIEVLVINDGSNDSDMTKVVAMNYRDKIRYFEKRNGGSSSAINLGIRNMTGEWFTWLSHDDLYKPEKIYENIRMLNYLDIEKDELVNQVLVSASESIDANGKLIRTPTPRQIKDMQNKVLAVKDNAEIIAEPTGFFFHGCTYFISKTVFEKIGGFDESLRLLNDADMWFRLYSNGYKLRYIPKVLVQGRIHSKQVSNAIGFSYHNSEQDQYWKKCCDWLLENARGNYGLFYRYGRNAFLKTRNEDGERAFRIAESICPEKKVCLRVKKEVLKARAAGWGLLKRVYLKLFIRKD